MHILVDADACPRAAKEILYRAAVKRGVKVTLFANQRLTVPDDANIAFVRVEHGFDVADAEIVARVTPGDVVVTADIPLADEAVKQGAVGIDPRGTLFTPETIGSLRAARELMMTFRDAGLEQAGPPPYSPQDKQQFANQLDRLLTQYTQRNA